MQGARPNFDDFQEDCVRAYNLLRQHAKLFIDLFVLMLPAAMPELYQPDHIEYLKHMLSLELTDQEAKVKFLDEIKSSLDDTFRKVDNWVHNLKHG